MRRKIVLGLLCLCCFCEICNAFFLLKAKLKAKACKVCPVYCSPKRRSDIDSASSERIERVEHYHHVHWWDDESDDFWPPMEEYHYTPPPHWREKPWWTTTPPTTTTTQATTTPEPSGICIFCMKKCGYPNGHWYQDYWWW